MIFTAEAFMAVSAITSPIAAGDPAIKPNASPGTAWKALARACPANVDTGDQITLAPEEGDTDTQAALDAFHEDNNCYTIEDVDGNTVTDPQGILYMTANSASGSKYYELLSTQQDYVAARSQNWLPSYSVITMSADSFSIDTYQITDDGKTEAIDDTFTIQKSGTDTSADTTDASETETDASAN